MSRYLEYQDLGKCDPYHNLYQNQWNISSCALLGELWSTWTNGIHSWAEVIPSAWSQKPPWQTNLILFDWILFYLQSSCLILHKYCCFSEQAVLNFVLYKFGHLPQREWQIMHDLAKMFLHCLNHWKLETPTAKKQHSQNDDLAAYKVNYTRYLSHYNITSQLLLHFVKWGFEWGSIM